MIKFSNKSIDNETLAQKLKRARQTKKIKLSDAAKKLNINLKYLQALERGRYQDLPSGVYGKNFLKEYAWLIGLDAQELVNLYQVEKENSAPTDSQSLFSNQIIKRYQLWAVSKIVKNLLIALAILVCFCYLGYLFKQAVSPPKLVIYSPEENFITHSSIITIIGQAEPEAYLTINEELVLVDTEGNFSKNINLKNGVNVITIVCNKKYGRDQVITRHILLE